MTTKFTKQEIQEIIAEEYEKLLNEVSMKGLANLLVRTKTGKVAGTLQKLTNDIAAIMADSKNLRKTGEKIDGTVSNAAYYNDAAGRMRILSGRIKKITDIGGKKLPPPDLENLSTLAQSLAIGKTARCPQH